MGFLHRLACSFAPCSDILDGGGWVGRTGGKEARKTTRRVLCCQAVKGRKKEGVHVNVCCALFAVFYTKVVVGSVEKR